ncbi:MAG: hypothetical protein MK085_09880 [Phycisphaerales bacterium]|nr:hypothetical protein [Phycisphaerales bacterium]
MRLQVVSTHLAIRTVRTRIPFKFGVHVLEDVPLAELVVEVETADHQRGVGRSSDLLVPKWFEKNPDTTPAEDSEALRQSAENASRLAVELGQAAGPHPVFDIWNVAHQDLVARHDPLPSDVLVRGFGTALLERALIDAACRLSECSFSQALGNDLFEFHPERIVPGTDTWQATSLPSPAKSIELRHTVGMLDPLRVEDILPVDRVDDGLPQALDEDIATYGLRWFKVKVCGDAAKDAPRLRAIAEVVMPMVGDDARFTLDGNEQCTDIEAFAGMLEDLADDPAAGPLVERLALIEQPLPRNETFQTEANRALPRLARIAPVIIDEADTNAEAFRHAIDLGYSGVSIKACKGIFRSLANRALIDLSPESGLFQSGEDLTNLGSIPLQQDLALQAVLGVEHVERNGHHYFRGLDHLPPPAADRLASALPQLYQRRGDLIHLAIKDGTISLNGVIDAPGLGGPLASIEDTVDANSE